MFAFGSLITWTVFMQMKIDLESQTDGSGQTQLYLCFRGHEWKRWHTSQYPGQLVLYYFAHKLFILSSFFIVLNRYYRRNKF